MVAHCSEVQFSPQFFPNRKIISDKTARNHPKLQKLAKIARLRENAKVAKKSCAPQHRNFLVGLISYVA